MFSNNVKATLLCGPKELNESFMFEAAMHWAEEGERVVYITPMPLERRPAACHDRCNPTVASLKLMRFIYLSDYETLVDQLVQLHTYAVVPSVLLIDDLDNYLDNDAVRNDSSGHIARTCTLILHSIKSCSRVLRTNVSEKLRRENDSISLLLLNYKVHVCVWTSSILIDNCLRTIYFRNIWNLTQERDGNAILLERFSAGLSVKRSYKYHKFEDGMRVLKQTLYDSIEN